MSTEFGRRIMKSYKRLIGAILLACMIFASVTTAFAAGTGKLTISNAARNVDYTIYRMFNASGTGTSVTYSYPATNSELHALVEASGVFKPVKAGSDYVVQLVAGKGESDIRSWINENGTDLIAASTECGTKSITGDTAENTIEFTGLDLGYYLVVPAGTGKKISAVSVADEGTIIDKNSNKPGNVKKTASNSEGAYKTETQIGDKIDYKVKFLATNYETIPASGAEPATTSQIVKYELNDSHESALKYVEGSLKVKYYLTDDETGTAKNVDFSSGTSAPNCTMNWVVGDASKYPSDIYVVITYQMEVTKDALTKSLKNTATVNYYTKKNPSTPKATTPSDAELYSTGIKINKQDETGSGLAGANFILYRMDGSTKMYYNSKMPGTKELWCATRSDAEVVTSSASSTEFFKGLRSGDYFLEEISAPDGYIPTGEPIPVTVKYNETTHTFTYNIGLSEIKVVNTKQGTLPSTGGAGTLLLIIGGSILFLAAGIILVTKKRMYNEG